MKSLMQILSVKRYFAVSWVFCSLNMIIGTWVLYIPYVKHKLSLNDSQIGFALFCLALGLLTFIPLVPYLAKKIGIGKYTVIGISIFGFAFMGPLLASNYSALCALLFFCGAFSGTTDVTMNALISAFEKHDGVKIMSAAHGFFSVGGAIGGLLGSFLISLFTHPAYHMLTVAAIVLLTNTYLSKHYKHIKEEHADNERKTYSFNKLKPLFIIAFLAFVIMSGEGSVEHWSSLYLLEIVKMETENFAAMGFVMFSITMTIGRFFGDGISEKIGSLKIIILGCLVAALGYFLVLTKIAVISILGFAIVGIGLSVIIPELFRIAGETDGVKPSTGISFVSGIGIFGFLIGPVILGYISNTYDLSMSFSVLLALMAIALLASLYQFKINGR